MESNRELIKNLLKNRNCMFCARNGIWSWLNIAQNISKKNNGKKFCEMMNFKPRIGVCSQWKMLYRERRVKDKLHAQEKKEKRKAHRKAKVEVA